jgi:hypothetical protein
VSLDINHVTFVANLTSPANETQVCETIHIENSSRSQPFYRNKKTKPPQHIVVARQQIALYVRSAKLPSELEYTRRAPRNATHCQVSLSHLLLSSIVLSFRMGFLMVNCVVVCGKQQTATQTTNQRRTCIRLR